MRKNQIKPGVIYAYQRNRDGSDRPTPIVFLTAPADGILYREANPTTVSAGGSHTPAPRTRANQIAAGTGYGSRSTGYPAVMVDYNAVVILDDLLKLTLDDFEKTTSNHGTGIEGARFTVVTSLATITGPYDEVMAAYNERRDADRQQREQDQARTAGHLTIRAVSLNERLARFGVGNSVERASSGYLKITLDEAEKLLTLLEGSRATEA